KVEKLKKLIVKTTNYKGIVIKILEEKPKVVKEVPKQIKIKTEVSPILKKSLKLTVPQAAELYVYLELKKKFNQGTLPINKLPYLTTRAKQYNEPKEVFQQYFNKYPNPPSDEHKIKLQEKLKEFDQKIEEFIEGNLITKRIPIQEENRVYNYKKKEYRKQISNYIEEEEIDPENLTDEEITTYLVYSLVIADRSRVKTSLETISRKSFNVRNWLKHTQSEFEPPKNLERLTSLISEFDGSIEKYRDWKNQLENAFKAIKLGDLIIFGRYSGIPKKGYALRERNYDSTGNNASECRWSTEIMQTVFAIVKTKLRKDALEVFDTEIATINCYFRSNLDNANNLKDTTNYPIKGINYLQAAGNWHASATAEGTRVNPNVTDATQQKGFRDVFDENFTRDSVQSLNQKEFLKFNFYKNLDWSDDSGFRKQMNQYKKLKQ
ncbi:6147_t:CDS:2, partial [Dentiscutata erythropus]